MPLVEQLQDRGERLERMVQQQVAFADGAEQVRLGLDPPRQAGHKGRELEIGPVDGLVQLGEAVQVDGTRGLEQVGAVESELAEQELHLAGVAVVGNLEANGISVVSAGSCILSGGGRRTPLHRPRVAVAGDPTGGSQYGHPGNRWHVCVDHRRDHHEGVGGAAEVDRTGISRGGSGGTCTTASLTSRPKASRPLTCTMKFSPLFCVRERMRGVEPGGEYRQPLAKVLFHPPTLGFGEVLVPEQMDAFASERR